MIKVWNTPGVRLFAVMFTGILLVLLTVHIALLQPKLDFPFQAGDTIKVQGQEITLEPLDLMHEPGELENHAQLNRFYQRQEQLSQMFQTSSSVTVVSSGQSSEIVKKTFSLADLRSEFWIPIIVGLGALAISGWIWALRSQDLASTLFALSGASIFVSAVPSAIYTSRDLFLPSALFWILETLNAWGAALFGIFMVGLFLIYPTKVPKWKPLLIGQFVLFTLWTLGLSLQVVPDVANIGLIIITLMLLIVVTIVAQFFLTKNNPTARASLIWLGLSVIVGAGGFVGLTTLPSVIGTKPLHQSYTFLFFLIIYLGLAAGLKRYRLFEVGQWAFRFLFYAVGAVILVLLDAALIFALGMDRLPALGLALLAIGFLYLPLRDIAQRYFSKTNRLEPHTLLSEVLHVAFAPSPTQRSLRWENLLRKLFDPLNISEVSTHVEKTRIAEDGLVLLIPSSIGTPALKLSYPWSGRGLFNLKSKDLAQQIVSLLEQAESSRSAYDRGVSEERRRVAQDLHDDVGARLLTGLSIADDSMRPTIQGAIADIRSIVSGIAGEQISLEQLLADLRHETHRRLSAAQIQLLWPDEYTQDHRLLDYRQHKALSSAIREVVSNTIRHSGATNFSFALKTGENQLVLELSDDGKGIPPEILAGQGSGFGLNNLKRRLEDLGGNFHVESMSPGTKFIFSIPYQLPL